MESVFDFWWDFCRNRRDKDLKIGTVSPKSGRMVSLLRTDVQNYPIRFALMSAITDVGKLEPTVKSGFIYSLVPINLLGYFSLIITAIDLIVFNWVIKKLTKLNAFLAISCPLVKNSEEFVRKIKRLPNTELNGKMSNIRKFFKN